jgi:hypothetical protein
LPRKEFIVAVCVVGIGDDEETPYEDLVEVEALAVTAEEVVTNLPPLAYAHD